MPRTPSRESTSRRRRAALTPSGSKLALFPDRAAGVPRHAVSETAPPGDSRNSRKPRFRYRVRGRSCRFRRFRDSPAAGKPEAS